MPRTSEQHKTWGGLRAPPAWCRAAAARRGAPRDEEAMRYQTNSLSGTAERERLAASERAPANRPHGSGNGRAGASWGVRE